MFHLPRTMPADVRTLLEKQLEDVPLEEVIDKILPVVVRLFNARDAVFFLHRERENHTEPVISRFSSAVQGRTSAAGDALLANWILGDFDNLVTTDLQSRNSCVSYSAFSWPYGSLKSHEGEVSLPPEFTLLLPVASHLSVRHDRDIRFNGYFALFFEAFPQLTDHIVQLIAYLPATLSDVMLSYIRSDGNDLSEFAHDMKRSLLFAADQLHVLESSPEKSAETLSKLSRTLTHMTHRASAILLADRVQANNLKISSLPINLNEVVQEAVSSFQPRISHSRAELRIELADDLPLSPIDPAVFPTVIENLLDNALKYSGKGACIVLRTKKSGSENVRLEILDNGCGIPEAEWAAIFLKHYRGKNPDGATGNGLGLYLVRKIVEAHHGKVYPEKSDAMKTCFVVELPAVSAS